MALIETFSACALSWRRNPSQYAALARAAFELQQAVVEREENLGEIAKMLIDLETMRGDMKRSADLPELPLGVEYQWLTLEKTLLARMREWKKSYNSLHGGFLLPLHLLKLASSFEKLLQDKFNNLSSAQQEVASLKSAIISLEEMVVRHSGNMEQGMQRALAEKRSELIAAQAYLLSLRFTPKVADLRKPLRALIEKIASGQALLQKLTADDAILLQSEASKRDAWIAAKNAYHALTNKWI